MPMTLNFWSLELNSYGIQRHLTCQKHLVRKSHKTNDIQSHQYFLVSYIWDSFICMLFFQTVLEIYQSLLPWAKRGPLCMLVTDNTNTKSCDTHTLIRYFAPHLSSLLRDFCDTDAGVVIFYLLSVCIQPQEVSRHRSLGSIRVLTFLP